MSEQLGLIQNRNQKFKELFEGGDIEALGDALYVQDCKMMVPGEKTAEGKEDAKKLLTSLKTEGAVVVNLQAIEVGPVNGGDVLYERGDYDFAKADKTPLKMGKYLVIWKRIDGEYKRYTEILNSGNNSNA
ncbi:uncharacterized protein LOC119737296 isoform X2 [Patiria miniata]|nr:uncharacterized protein LOC119737296 isoform X2 [Patiria miniata]XP_038067474.1 uncharacterized protein LOC119737296 isoform X2 [Patiria miniata]XP_038067484.1 uncharacterized protein LOC119737296 isoform X2 [Patiria miniata]XP_038067494.1 uncharacterized protein LOC119737296 isoform X2 [Patiria miniata]XP_038067503.1 uncharacterized protein LOC119737296 isoform X2 [Patiria miniata]